jgi:hypothetical protein
MLLSMHVGAGKGIPEQHVAPGLHVVWPQTWPLNDVSHMPELLQISDGRTPLVPGSFVPSSAMVGPVGHWHSRSEAARLAAHVSTLALFAVATPAAR